MKNWYVRGLLRDPEPGAGGGDGGKPDALTPEAVKAMISQEVNGAIGRLEKEGKKQWKTISDQLASLTGKPPEGGGDGGGGDGGGDSKPSPQLKSLEMRLKSIEEQNKKLNETIDTERSKSDRMERQTALTTALTAFRWRDDDCMRGVFENLSTRVKRSEDGQIVGVLSNGDEVPLKDFIEVESKRTFFKAQLLPEEMGGAGAKRGSSSSVDPRSFLKPGATQADIDKYWAAHGIKR